jgi:hypothetical protein
MWERRHGSCIGRNSLHAQRRGATASSQAYTDVVEVKTPVVIKAATFLEGAALTAPTTLAIDVAAPAER